MYERTIAVRKAHDVLYIIEEKEICLPSPVRLLSGILPLVCSFFHSVVLIVIVSVVDCFVPVDRLLAFDIDEPTQLHDGLLHSALLLQLAHRQLAQRQFSCVDRSKLGHRQFSCVDRSKLGLGSLKTFHVSVTVASCHQLS